MAKRNTKQAKVATAKLRKLAAEAGELLALFASAPDGTFIKIAENTSYRELVIIRRRTRRYFKKTVGEAPKFRISKVA